jgi:hypothetical protein
MNDHSTDVEPVPFDQFVADLISVSTRDAASPEPGALPAPVLSAIGATATASPTAIEAFQAAVKSGDSLRVAFPPEIRTAIANQTLRLMSTADGRQVATAVDGSGRFVAHARVVGGAGSSLAPKAGAVGVGAAFASTAVLVLPIALASIAAYAQQQRLEQAMDNTKATLDRIEERLHDADHGVCDAADSFVELASGALTSGPLPPYLRAELAIHRAQVEVVYGARRRYVRRFKARLEQQQIEFEQKKGERQPWVDHVEEMAKTGKLEEEIVLFVRALISQSRLDALAAMCIAEEGMPELSGQLLRDSALELRSEFFDLHNRLAPLARFAPPRSMRDRLPGVSKHLEQAHDTAKALVEQLDARVLPSIPDPDADDALVIEISSEDVREIHALLPAA